MWYLVVLQFYLLNELYSEVHYSSNVMYFLIDSWYKVCVSYLSRGVRDVLYKNRYCGGGGGGRGGGSQFLVGPARPCRVGSACTPNPFPHTLYLDPIGRVRKSDLFVLTLYWVLRSSYPSHLAHSTYLVHRSSL